MSPAPLRASLAGVTVVVVVAVTFVMGGVAAGPAGAHAGFVSASPAPCEVVTGVAQVVVDFDQPIVAEHSGIELADGDGELVAAGEAVAGSLPGGSLVVELGAPLPPGDYRVSWRNVSLVDSDPSRGGYGFTVGDGDAVAAAGCSHTTGEAAAGSDAGEGTGLPLVLILAVGGAAVAGVAVLVAVRRRSSTPA